MLFRSHIGGLITGLSKIYQGGASSSPHLGTTALTYRFARLIAQPTRCKTLFEGIAMIGHHHSVFIDDMAVVVPLVTLLLILALVYREWRRA